MGCGLDVELVALGGARGTLSQPPSGSVDSRTAQCTRILSAQCTGTESTPGGSGSAAIFAVLGVGAETTQSRPCVQSKSHPPHGKKRRKAEGNGRRLSRSLQRDSASGMAAATRTLHILHLTHLPPHIELQFLYSL